VKEKRPDLVFLMENKLRNNKMEKVRTQLGFDNMFVVECVGRSGGLAMLWRAEAEVEIQNFSHRHINAIVRPNSFGFSPWKITGFYGHLVANKREEGWSLLWHIATLEPDPWICLGDFNEILNETKKFGGRSQPRALMEAFQNTLEVCGLFDLGFKGPKYTWSNCQEGPYLIKERLDRVVANRSWCELFREVEVWVGVAIRSDHSPVIL
jgi:exonuclease III